MRLTRLQRLRQITRWLCDEFPPKDGTHVVVRWVERVPPYPSDDTCSARGYMADCTRGDKRFDIRVSSTLCTTVADVVESIMHEWAHILNWGKTGEHHDGYWRAYGRIYRAYHDDGGEARSREYPSST